VINTIVTDYVQLGVVVVLTVIVIILYLELRKARNGYGTVKEKFLRYTFPEPQDGIAGITIGIARGQVEHLYVMLDEENALEVVLKENGDQDDSSC
jgi:hypothetical protein